MHYKPPEKLGTKNFGSSLVADLKEFLSLACFSVVTLIYLVTCCHNRPCTFDCICEWVERAGIKEKSQINKFQTVFYKQPRFIPFKTNKLESCLHNWNFFYDSNLGPTVMKKYLSIKNTLEKSTATVPGFIYSTSAVKLNNSKIYPCIGHLYCFRYISNARQRLLVETCSINLNLLTYNKRADSITYLTTKQF